MAAFVPLARVGPMRCGGIRIVYWVLGIGYWYIALDRSIIQRSRSLGGLAAFASLFHWLALHQ